ncbi:peptide/nickel transport system substrate-binding protein [Rhizobiales bacterium GAS113]|nr:peptide/nickel transport system substrate-binding protein [Rhizobiales bacterium GAS113]
MARMRSFKRLAMAGTIGLAACFGLERQALAAHDDLTIGVAQFPSGFNFYIDAETIKDYVLSFVTRPVTAFDKDWKNSCLLCSELPTVKNGLAKLEDRPDGTKGMAITIKLKPGLKWGDGAPVTAKDIAFTARVARDPKAGFYLPKAWARTEKVDVVDDQTAVMHLDSIQTNYNEWAQLLPEHIEGPVYEQVAASGGYNKQSVYNRNPTTPGLYNGPYLIKDYQSGGQVVLEQNPYWSGEKPHFRRVIIKFIQNTAALQANLLSGDVDMVAGEGIALTIDQALELRKQHPDDFTYLFVPSLAYEHIELAHDNKLLQDLRVRQALVHATDRKTLTDKLFQGLQPVANAFVPPKNVNFSKDVPAYPYDPAKAKALLTEAGFTPGPDGICRNDKGERLSFEFTTTAGNRLRELQQQVLQSGWKAACIEVTIKNEPARTMFGETLKKRLFPGMVMYASTFGVTESPRRNYSSFGIPTEANSFGGSNYSGISIPRLDELVLQSEKELDPEKQIGLWAEMQTIYATVLPHVPLFFRAEPHINPKWLKGYVTTGHSDLAPLWAEYWRAE